MAFTPRSALVAIALVAAPALAAVDLGGTSWTLSGRERTAVTNVGARTARVDGATLQIDAAGAWTFVHPETGTLTGTTVPGRGRRFTLVLDPASAAALEAVVVAAVLRETGGSGVEVKRFTTSARGSLRKSGKMVLKVRARAVGRVLGLARGGRGAASFRAKLSGTQNAP